MADFDEMRGAMRRATCGTLSGYTGGCRCDDCRKANTTYNVAYRHRRRKGEVTTAERAPIGCLPGKLSLAPIVALYPKLDNGELAVRCGVSLSSINRWWRDGMNLDVADKVAIHLGRHPFELWGDAYWRAK